MAYGHHFKMAPLNSLADTQSLIGPVTFIVDQQKPVISAGTNWEILHANLPH